MGSEPIVEALDRGAQLIVAGRAYDPAPFAALPIREGYDPGLATHLGKILECGALCAEPGTAKDAIIGYRRQDHFAVEALNPERRCTTTSVARLSVKSMAPRARALGMYDTSMLLRAPDGQPQSQHPFRGGAHLP